MASKLKVLARASSE